MTAARKHTATTPAANVALGTTLNDGGGDGGDDDGTLELEPPSPTPNQQRLNTSLSPSADDTLLEGELIFMYSMDSSGFTVAPPQPQALVRPPSTSPVMTMMMGTTAHSHQASSEATPTPSSAAATTTTTNPEHIPVPVAGQMSGGDINTPTKTLLTHHHCTDVATLTQVAERLEHERNDSMTTAGMRIPPAAAAARLGPRAPTPTTPFVMERQPSHPRPELLHQRSISENSETCDTAVVLSQTVPRDHRQTPHHKGRFVVVQPPQSPGSTPPPISAVLDSTFQTQQPPPAAAAAIATTATNALLVHTSSPHHNPTTNGSWEEPTESERMSSSQRNATLSPSNNNNNNNNSKLQPPIVIRQRSMPSNTKLAIEQASIPPPPSQQGSSTGSSGPAPHSTPPDVVAMVNSPDANGQIVTKKKGRFNFMEHAPSSRSASPGRMPESISDTTATDAALVVVERQRHERSYSASAAVVSSHTPPLSSVHAGTDGSSAAAAPVVTKKGRFVVTSVPAQASSSSSSSSQQGNPEQNSATMLSDSNELQSLAEITSPNDSNSAQMAELTQLESTATEPFVVRLPVLNGPEPPPLALTTAPIRSSPVPMLPSSVHTVESCAPLSTPPQQPPLPLLAGSGGGDETGLVTFASSRGTTTGTLRPTAGRVGSSVANGQQQQGFGKLLYFLDQMRLEVMDADKSIKSLQTDMKCLKEKNKELETKARDMERKWNQEKALREVADTRVKALKRRLKSLESNAEALVAEDESVATYATSGFHSRANSMEGGIIDTMDAALVSNPLSVHIESSKHIVASSESTGTLDTIDGGSSATTITASRNTSTGNTTTTTTALVRHSMDGSPPREGSAKKKLVQNNAQSPTITFNNAQQLQSTIGESNVTGSSSKGAATAAVQPPLATIINIHEAGNTNGTNSTAAGPPPRPKTRHDNSNPGSISSSLALTLPHATSEFDPLRSLSRDPTSTTTTTVLLDNAMGGQSKTGTHLHPTALLFNETQNTLQQYAGTSLHSVEDSVDFLMPSLSSTRSTFLPPTHPTLLSSEPTGLVANSDGVLSSSGSLVTMLPYQDNPSLIAAAATNFNHLHRQNQNHHHEPSSSFVLYDDTASHYSVIHSGQEDDNLFAEDPNMTTSSSNHRTTTTDPFDELIQQRQPTNGS